jgi:AMP-polyphosphate phosphotransferase
VDVETTDENNARDEKVIAMENLARAQSQYAPRNSYFDIMADYPRLDEVDHTLVLDEETYRKRLKKLQKKLYELEAQMYQRRIPLMVMYEGWDAAGKGGNIKRVAQALDARAYTIFPSPAPTRPELLHPHLWRYWTRLPKAGHVGIYDRSWYGRVLVERVEGFATNEQWSRAYDEINEFERDLVEWGAILLKFWVDIHPDEQLRRFHARQADPAKQWKITDEDWRNREKYPLYKAAAQDMFRLTSTPFAPWYILESDDKRYARIKALEIIVAALKERLR